MAFGLSAMMVGCDSATKQTKPAPKSGVGSTTGGGAEVPAAPSAGKAETPVVPAKPAEPAPAVDPAPKVDPAPAADPTPKAEEPPKN